MQAFGGILDRPDRWVGADDLGHRVGQQRLAMWRWNYVGEPCREYIDRAKVSGLPVARPEHGATHPVMQDG
ncbi:MAG: hypothetical protein ACRDQZ_00035, partial [Mycobacteriales bacterium]